MRSWMRECYLLNAYVYMCILNRMRDVRVRRTGARRRFSKFLTHATCIELQYI